MAKEYIDREAYCNSVCECNKEQCGKSECPIWTAPAADVVEVVRCKDCECYEMDVEYYGGGHKDICRLFKRQTQHNDFCSYGERKDNG